MEGEWGEQGYASLPLRAKKQDVTADLFIYLFLMKKETEDCQVTRFL